MCPSVLICEEETHVARIAALKLDRAGFDVQTAAEAETAWELLHRTPPSLLVLDYRLPGVDGLTFLARLRADDTIADMPAILLVPPEVELGDELVRFAELGIVAALRKPFSARRLVQLAHEACECAPAWV